MDKRYTEAELKKLNKNLEKGDVIYKKYKKDITLLIYDGFIARKNIDTKELEELVLKETGFVVRYTKELIQ